GEHPLRLGMRPPGHSSIAELAESARIERQPIELGATGSRLAIAGICMEAVALPSAHTATWQEASSQALPWVRTKIVGLVLATALALTFRIGALSTYGFSEDELNKVHAIEQYRKGDFGAN